jgi:hypothetical protein
LPQRLPRFGAAAFALLALAGVLTACSGAGVQYAGGEAGVETPRRGRAAPAAGTLQAYALAGPANRTDRGCLVSAAASLLAQLEAQFGPVRVVSTCRNGATIAGTRRPSMHRFGKAFDFIAPAGRKAAIIRWLRANSPGVTMTYRGMHHVHTDVGSYRRVILGAGGRRAARRQSRMTGPNAVQ